MKCRTIPWLGSKLGLGIGNHSGVRDQPDSENSCEHDSWLGVGLESRPGSDLTIKDTEMRMPGPRVFTDEAPTWGWRDTVSGQHQVRLKLPGGSSDALSPT